MYRALVLASLTFFLATISSPPPVLAKAPPQPQVQEPRPVLSPPPGYRYDSRGRRDPFVNPIPTPPATPAPPPAIAVSRPPGLKGVLVTEVNLLGVVTSKDPSMNRVVIQAPGNKTYFAASGDFLFDAVIKEIRPDAVVFTLRTLVNTPQQQPANRELVRKVRPAPGENQ